MRSSSVGGYTVTPLLGAEGPVFFRKESALALFVKKKLLGTSALLVVTMFAIRNKCIATNKDASSSFVKKKNDLGAKGIATRSDWTLLRGSYQHLLGAIGRY